jgi:hypothetical protein
MPISVSCAVLPRPVRRKTRGQRPKRRSRHDRDGSSALETAKRRVRWARWRRARRRQHMRKQRKMKAHPSAMSRICHQGRPLLRGASTVGASIPLTVGSGSAEVVPDATTVGTRTSVERHTPKPDRTAVLSVQVALEHAPAERTSVVGLAHARHALGPGPEQELQEPSQALQDEVVLSKYSPRPQVGRHRPLASTGRPGGHEAHWPNAPPVQVAQSGWQATHDPAEVKVDEGQEETQVPLFASWLFAQVRQKSARSVQVLQEEEHGVQVLVEAERKVPVGHDSMHLPLERTWPGRHPVHCSWSTVEATLKLGSLHAVHLDGQPMCVCVR